MDNNYIKLEDSLEHDDWALIISKDGELKGLFIPEGKEDEEVPGCIIKICKLFGIDPHINGTIH